jgi:tetratricopeptide (TPR) repeat protein
LAPAYRGRILTNLGHALIRTGAHGEARQVLSEAISAAGDPLSAAHARTLLGDIALRSGELDAAEREYLATATAWRDSGARLDAANTLNNLGDVRRARGDLAGAVAAYRESLAGFEAIGAGIAVYPAVNLGLVLLADGDYRGACAALEDALRRSRGRGTIAGMIHLFLLPCAVALGDGPGWEAHWGGGTEVLAAGVVDPDIAAALERAGDLASGAQALRAWSAAAAQWRGLGRAADAERVQRRSGGP